MGKLARVGGPELGVPGWAAGIWVLAWGCYLVLWVHQGSFPRVSACALCRQDPQLSTGAGPSSLCHLPGSPPSTLDTSQLSSLCGPLPTSEILGASGKGGGGCAGSIPPAACPAVCSPIISFFQRKKNLPSQAARPLMGLLLGRHQRGHIKDRMALALTPEIHPISTIMQVTYL